jgi:lysylphosphatidylglycerol synthetase-like protein (DUF2156 family)
VLISYFNRLYRFDGLNQFRAKLLPDRVEPVYALIWPRLTLRSGISLGMVLSRPTNR